MVKRVLQQQQQQQRHSWWCHSPTKHLFMSLFLCLFICLFAFTHVCVCVSCIFPAPTQNCCHFYWFFSPSVFFFFFVYVGRKRIHWTGGRVACKGVPGMQQTRLNDIIMATTTATTAATTTKPAQDFVINSFQKSERIFFPFRFFRLLFLTFS